MAERRVTVANADGLHARPAAVFVKAAADTGIAVRIAKSGADRSVDARSILAILSLDVRHGDEVILHAADETALEKLATLLEDANV
jgi:phosphocarrier protein HPr